jgi:putative transposase
LWLCRNLYNTALDQRNNAWKFDHESVRYIDQANELKEIKFRHPEYKDIHSQAEQDVLRRLDKVFKDFFRRIQDRKDGKRGKAGYPRFKGRYRYNSITYPQSGFEFIDERHMSISKFDSPVRIIRHREVEGKVKTMTLKRYSDGHWYAFFVTALPDVDIPLINKPKNPVGLDVGLTDMVTLTTGEKIGNPKWLRKSERRLKHACQKFSKTEKRSKRHEKRRLKIARLDRKVFNRKNDFHHKLSRRLVDEFDFIAVEELKIRNMVRNRHFSKSISDAGWGDLFNKTAYKASNAGKWFIRAPAYNSSQECSKCHELVPKDLSVRVHDCPYCGLKLDRDVNASKITLQRGLDILSERIESLPPERRKVKLVKKTPSARSKVKVDRVRCHR